MLDDYEQQQSARMKLFEESVMDAVRNSFDDTVIVERIIYHIKKKLLPTKHKNNNLTSYGSTT